ncbi:MAG: IS21-like element helper ATPase IstB [Candidatus Thermoplasmatota archaeon]
MTTRQRRKTSPVPAETHARVLAHLSSLNIVYPGGDLDAALARAEKESLSYLDILDLVLGEICARRRERSIQRRIREARFVEHKTLETFDWDFNRKCIDRNQIEAIARCDFVRRNENLVFVGASGLGKSHLLQAIGIRACVEGFGVRYTTSASLLQDLTASLADDTLPARLRYYERYSLLIIDEFGFDHIERKRCREATSVLYKVIQSRAGKRSTALATNVDFDCWGEYLGDPPVAMAFLDRLVDRALVLKLVKGRSYRAHKAQMLAPPSDESTTEKPS